MPPLKSFFSKKREEEEEEREIEGDLEETLEETNSKTEKLDESRTLRLLEFTNLINSYLNLDALLNKVIDLVIKHTEAQRGLLMLYSEKSNSLTFHIGKDHSGNKIEESDFRYTTSVVEKVLKEGEPVCITDMEKDSELKGAHSIRMLRIQSVMCVPLRVLRKVSKSSREKRLKTIGIIYVDSHSASRVFNDDDMQLLLALANQAATEIDKARVYRELERAHKNLLELDRMKNEFIAIASHELHTPLTSIVGFLDLFEMQEKQHKLPDVFKEGMDIIREGVNNLAKKINEITQIAAIDEYRLELKLKKVPLKAFLRESSRRFIPFIKKRNQTLSLQLQKNLPTVILDPEKIQIVLSNLMTNAIRFTPDGGKLKLRAGVNPKDASQILISVVDTGIGIPEEDYDRIFEKFVVLGDVMQHSSGTIEFRTSGVGLGLAIAKGIVESHGGAISVNSKVDNGSTFTFSLPIEGKMDMAKSFEI